MKKIGTLVKDIRKDQHMTQKALADGICSQSMLSAIENNEYLPNAAIFIQLAQHLNINLSQISLADNFDISSEQQFNQTVAKLCGEHKYQELLDFLQREDVIDQLEDGKLTQAYYYYLGVAQLQTGHRSEAVDSMKLSLAEAEERDPSTLSRLGFASMACAYAYQQQPQMAKADLVKAFKNLNQVKYEKDQNILFYLSALVHYILKDNQTATNQLMAGIDFISQHDSHYMLANSYYLLSVLAEKANKEDEKLEADRRKNIFSDLFGEKVFEDL